MIVMTIKRASFTYYFKKESVILEIPRSERMGNTYVSFNCYSMRSRKKFKDFKKELSESKRSQYTNINDIYGLATRYDVRATNGHKPTITDSIAF